MEKSSCTKQPQRPSAKGSGGLSLSQQLSPGFVALLDPTPWARGCPWLRSSGRSSQVPTARSRSPRCGQARGGALVRGQALAGAALLHSRAPAAGRGLRTAEAPAPAHPTAFAQGHKKELRKTSLRTVLALFIGSPALAKGSDTFQAIRHLTRPFAPPPRAGSPPHLPWW